MLPYLQNSLIPAAMPWPDWTDNIVLAANTPQSYTVPKGYKFMVLASDQTIYMAAYGQTATIPSGNITNGTGVLPGTGAMFDIERISRDGGSISLSTKATGGSIVGLALFTG